jgi:succinate-acetate transporter protein
VVLRPLASPFALGFLALAGAALTTAGLDLGWIDGAQRWQVGLLVLVFAPVPQLTASILAFLCRDPVAGTGMGIVAAAWAARGAMLLLTPAGSWSDALGTLLLVVAAALALSAVEAAGGKLVPAAVMATTALDFLLTALAELAGADGLRHAAGVVGVALAGLALYAAASLALEDLRGRTVLPTGRRGSGRAALRQDLAAQAADVAGEAGVRREL